MLIDTDCPDVIIITESHCNHLIPDRLISFKDFNLARVDRSVGRKGGVVLLTRTDFPISNIKVNAHPTGTWEGLFCDLLVSKVTTLRICSIYRTPGKLPDDAAADFFTFLEDSLPTKNSPYLLAGDFNLPTINWTTCTSTGSITASHFLDFFLNASLNQHVNFTTRYRAGNKPSLLDLVITDSQNSIAKLGSSHPLGKSDHLVIHFDFHFRRV